MPFVNMSQTFPVLLSIHIICDVHFKQILIIYGCETNTNECMQVILCSKKDVKICGFNYCLELITF